MEPIDRGPLDQFEVVWRNGHIDHVWAHQVTNTGNLLLFRDLPNNREPVIEFHGEVNGHWRLMLRAPEHEIYSIRNVTQVRETQI